MPVRSRKLLCRDCTREATRMRNALYEALHGKSDKFEVYRRDRCRRLYTMMAIRAG